MYKIGLVFTCLIAIGFPVTINSALGNTISPTFVEIIIDDYHEVPHPGAFPRFSSQRYFGSCEGLLRDFPPILGQAISKANKDFEHRRGWTKEFAMSRMGIAEKYWLQTIHQVVTDSENNDEVVGSIALTVAKYDRDHMPDYSKSPLENKAMGIEILPEEETLGVLLPRPLDSAGKGIILELRVYYVKRVVNKDVRKIILPDMLRLITMPLVKYPELLNQDIIHMYNDEGGIKLYAPFGLKLLQSITPITKPIFSKGTNWWALATTPETLQENTIDILKERAKKHIAVYDFKLPHKFRIPVLNKDILVSPDAEFLADYENGYAFFVLAEPLDILGLRIPSGTLVEIRHGKLKTKSLTLDLSIH